ncbi:hypothetical protein NAEGRDRAFT_81162 [Naegleria gruberi]|uniref:ZZ-type domain-containing protein n=1 Tax=Naegleria gruberi TaxID=5762 RepID=D2VTD2_NAEGR|nr:uncharacterized protein NAEGRDRAFT_81162 [Naegleria gruberi]EFC39910.1 hypothetical protein NAEGRDRAFT_81162 [Naegleria gruberi]|eukprot:XP_002672654.1 hypothetical protein NAEGRDRAFT_81162 [Naegleria gruberi strain NEG-M]
MSFPSSHLIYHPILANNNTNGQQVPMPQHQQQLPNLHNIFQPAQQQPKPIHVKVLVFETKKEDLSALETLKPTSIRRGERVLTNYADLTRYLTEKCGLTLENALIRYQDDENHWVDISSDEELAYGIQLCRESRTSAIRSVFRIAVILLKKEEEKPRQPEEEKRECPYWKGRRQGGCPFRRPRHHPLPENHPHCPFMFKKTMDGDNVLEVDIDVEQLKNGLNVNDFVRENIDKVQVPHFGVTCDGCGKYAFVGKRFKCDDCDDFDFCEDCFASETVRNAHFGGSHSFTEQQPRSACFLRNIFGAEKKEEETVIDNQLYEEQPVVVEEPVEEPVVVEEPVIVPEPVNVYQVPHPLNPIQQPIVEEPVVVVQEPIVQPQPTLYQTELALLRDMGFVDEVSNLILLNKYNGDLQRVIVDLIH